jgi:acyl carrier protein
MYALTPEQQSEIKEEVCDILEVDPDEVTDDSRFKEDHQADSMRAIEILASLERNLDVEIPQNEMARMVNLRGIYEVVSEALTAGAK